MHKSSGTRMSREGNRDTLKLACWHRVTNIQTVTSRMLRRELANVRREQRNWETGQHDSTGGTHGVAKTANDKLTHERFGHASCELR